MSAAPADVLAAIALLSESVGVLRPYAQDTGAFRVGNKGATELAAACAAAIKAAEACAAVADVLRATERLATAAERRDTSTGCAIAVMTARAELAAAAADARAALASAGGAK
ncbi:MAG TPA: hypothetical protein VIG97_11325 [Luteimonas sp.]